mgnify:CR=1 FL=1
MRRIFTFVLVVLLGVTVALVLREMFRTRAAEPSPLPAGDYEIAWIHTTTSPQTWERLVAAMFQIRREFPGVEIDDSRAFLDQTASVPEVVLSAHGRPDKLRVRWYKLSSEVGNRDWVKALAERRPAPIAFMGGGSSDRAIELAEALNEQTHWQGSRPLLFITTATANTVIDPETSEPKSLIGLYPGRTFRGCFTNEAMARAVVDFILQQEDLRPKGAIEARAYILAWKDDPYSVDLAEQFKERLQERKDLKVPLRMFLDKIGYSVGTFTEPNPAERAVMERILPDLASNPGDRALLVLPAVTQPTRRMLRSFAAESPLIGKRLVAVNGDGVSFNFIYRDGEVNWPIRELAIPLVLFAHQNPVAWGTDDKSAGSDSLQPPNSTDDVLLFADMIRVIAKGIYSDPRVTEADGLANKLRSGQPEYFNAEGERLTGKGEYVIVLRPQFLEGGRVSQIPVYDVFTRREKRWELVERLIGLPRRNE